MSNYSQAVELIIKSEMEGKPHHEVLLDLGDTPRYLVQHGGLEERRLVITGRVISKACFDHHVPTSLLKKLPEIVEKPKSLFRSATHDNDAVVVVTFELVNKTLPVVLPVHKDKRIGRSGLYNVIASIYGKDGEDPEVRWHKAGLHLWSS